MHVFPSNDGSSRRLDVGPRLPGCEPPGNGCEGEHDAFTDAPEALESWLTECIDIERQVREWLAEEERRVAEEAEEKAG